MDFRIDADGVMLAGEEAGQGSPVVLLHGLTATRRYVVMGSTGARARRPPRDRLRRARPRPVRRGPDPQDYGYERLADDLLAVLDDRGIDRAVLAGASMGAHTIIDVRADASRARRRPGDHDPGVRPRGPRPGAMDRWDRLAQGLREGGVEGFVEAYGTPNVPEKWLETIDRVLHQRLVRPRPPGGARRCPAGGPALAPVRGLERAGRDRGADGDRRQPRRGRPRAPVRDGERYADEIPGARLVSEEPGASPAGLAGRAGVQGDRRGRGVRGERTAP